MPEIDLFAGIAWFRGILKWRGEMLAADKVFLVPEFGGILRSQR